MTDGKQEESSRLSFDRFGAPSEVLRFERFELSRPGPQEALVRILAAPINPADLNFIEGSYGVKPQLPAVPGTEACGEVIESKDPGLVPGDRVVFLSRGGTWSTHATVPATALLRVPPDTDVLQAAMLKVNPATAWCLLHTFAELRPGDRVVQNLGNSAVGRCVIQLARDMRIRTTSFVRSPDQAAELLALGADDVFVDDEDGMRRSLEKMGGAEARLGFNAVGGESALRLIRQLSEGGTLVTYGAMGRKPVTVPNSPLIFRDIRLRGFWVSRWLERGDAGEIRQMYAMLCEMVRNGRLEQPVDSVHRLEEWRGALERLGAPDRKGKVLLRP